ncbi:MAG: type II toxin-antitoxin system Phd/YefM family antitoxin [Terracidiphilus sp.]
MVWQVYDAKARFSELLEAALKNGPQVVTRRGVETAVLVPIDEWKRLKAQSRPLLPESKPFLDDPLLDPGGPHDLDIPPRRRIPLRTPVEFE